MRGQVRLALRYAEDQHWHACILILDVIMLLVVCRNSLIIVKKVLFKLLESGGVCFHRFYVS